MVKFTRRLTGHFVTLIKNGMHIIRCISRHFQLELLAIVSSIAIIQPRTKFKKMGRNVLRNWIGTNGFEVKIQHERFTVIG